MTLEDLLYKIGETAIKNKIINFSAVGGDIYDLNVENVKDYPVLFAAPTGSHEVRENTTDYEVTFYFLDRLLSDSVNDVQIFSTAIEQLKLILTMVGNIKGVLDVSYDYDIQNFTETERMNDRVAGAFSTVNITVQNTSDCCDTEFITLMLKLENKTLNVTKNGKYTVTYNKQYDGLRKVEVDVNVDTETPYNDGFADGKEAGLEEGYVSGKQDGIAEGYESGKEDGLTEGYAEGKADGVAEGIDQGKGMAAEEAIVVEFNGENIYTKWSDNIPEWTHPSTGDDFYSYIVTGREYDTGYVLNDDSVVECWFNVTPLGIASSTILIGSEGGLRLQWDALTRLWLEDAEGTVMGFGYDDGLKEIGWIHLQISKNSVILNGVEQTLNREIKMGSTSSFKIGHSAIYYYFGMFKIDENVYTPSTTGFVDGNGNVVPSTGSFESTFVELVPPPIYDNLIKEVQIADGYIDVAKLGIRLGYSSFETIPDSITFENCTALDNMLSYCENMTNADSTSWEKLKSEKLTTVERMFEGSKKLTKIPDEFSEWNTSNVINMDHLFYDCSELTNPELLAGWITSNVTNMDYLFANCSKLTNADFMENWDTSKAVMNQMFKDCLLLERIPAIDCSSVYSYNYPLYTFSTYDKLTDVGGFLNLKNTWDRNYGLAKCPNLTRESCINILNGLYDYSGTSETRTLKVHANFITAVGDDISIATNKNWQVTA